MQFLLAHIVFASVFTLVLKWVQIRQREDIISIGAINYITAAAICFPEYYLTQHTFNSAAMLTGSLMGGCYFVAFFFVIFIIKQVGAASSVVVSSLSILFPIGFAACLWDEIPNGFQLVGVALAVVSLSLIGTGKLKPAKSTTGMEAAGVSSFRTKIVLLVFFLIAGLSRLSQRAFAHLSEECYRPTFLFGAFSVAALASVATLIIRKRRPTRTEFLFGVALGSANIFHSYCIMKALDRFPGYVVFPVSSAGGLVLTTVVATLLLTERNSGRTPLGIAIAVIALVLLNW